METIKMKTIRITIVLVAFFLTPSLSFASKGVWNDSEIRQFNQIYDKARRDLEACKRVGCADYRRLRLNFEKLRLISDMQRALRKYIAPWRVRARHEKWTRGLTGRARTARERNLMNSYLNIMNMNLRVGDRLPPRCARKFISWARCLNRNMNQGILLRIRGFEWLKEAMPQCQMTYRVFYACRDNLPLKMTRKQELQYRRERDVSRQHRYIDPMFELIATPAMRKLVDRGIEKRYVIGLLIRFGDEILQKLVEQTRGYDLAMLIQHGEMLLKSRIGQGVYSYRLPMTPAIAYFLPQLFPDTVTRRFNDDPMARLVNSGKRQRSWNFLVSSLDRPIYYQLRNKPYAKLWWESVRGRQVLVCHYRGKIGFYWYRKLPDHDVHEDDLYQYVLSEVADKCPASPGRMAVYRDRKAARRYLASPERPRFRRYLHPDFTIDDLHVSKDRVSLFGIDLKGDTIRTAVEKLRKQGFDGPRDHDCRFGKIEYKNASCYAMYRGDYEKVIYYDSNRDGRIDAISFFKMNYRLPQAGFFRLLGKRYGDANKLIYKNDNRGKRYGYVYPKTRSSGMLLFVETDQIPFLVRVGRRVAVVTTYPDYYFLSVNLVSHKIAKPLLDTMQPARFPGAGLLKASVDCYQFPKISETINVSLLIDLRGRTTASVPVTLVLNDWKRRKQASVTTTYLPKLIKQDMGSIVTHNLILRRTKKQTIKAPQGMEAMLRQYEMLVLGYPILRLRYDIKNFGQDPLERWYTSYLGCRRIKTVFIPHKVSSSAKASVKVTGSSAGIRHGKPNVSVTRTASKGRQILLTGSYNCGWQGKINIRFDPVAGDTALVEFRMTTHRRLKRPLSRDVLYKINRKRRGRKTLALRLMDRSLSRHPYRLPFFLFLRPDGRQGWTAKAATCWKPLLLRAVGTASHNKHVQGGHSDARVKAGDGRPARPDVGQHMAPPPAVQQPDHRAVSSVKAQPKSLNFSGEYACQRWNVGLNINMPSKRARTATVNISLSETSRFPAAKYRLTYRVIGRAWRSDRRFLKLRILRSERPHDLRMSPLGLIWLHYTADEGWYIRRRARCPGERVYLESSSSRVSR